MPFNIGDVAEVHSGSGSEDFVRIIRAQRLDVRRTTTNIFVDTGTTTTSVAASATSAVAKQSVVNPPKSELIELDGLGLRGGWHSNVLMNVKQPASVDQFGTSASPTSGTLDADISPYESPLVLSLFVVYERHPALQFTNNAPVAVSPELRIMGWRYELGRMPATPAEAEKDSSGKPTELDFQSYKQRGGRHSIIFVGGFSA